MAHQARGTGLRRNLAEVEGRTCLGLVDLGWGRLAYLVQDADADAAAYEVVEPCAIVDRCEVAVAIGLESEDSACSGRSLEEEEEVACALGVTVVGAVVLETCRYIAPVEERPYGHSGGAEDCSSRWEESCAA